MNSRHHYLTAGVALVSFFTVHTLVSAQDKERAELAKALQGVTVTLEQRLSAAAASGTPILGKFEVEDGKLELSAYTMKGDKFFEVVVDHKSGKVAKPEPIAGGDDLAAAKKQAEAMAKTQRSLRDVVANAEKANAGYNA